MRHPLGDWADDACSQHNGCRDHAAALSLDDAFSRKGVVAFFGGVSDQETLRENDEATALSRLDNPCLGDAAQ